MFWYIIVCLWRLSSWIYAPVYLNYSHANIKRNKHVTITSKRRNDYVFIALCVCGEVIFWNRSFFNTKNTMKARLSLNHWGRVTHICVSKFKIIGSDNGLSPGWCQAIILTNVGILLIGALGTKFSEILIESYIFIQENEFENVVWQMLAILSRPQCVTVL